MTSGPGRTCARKGFIAWRSVICVRSPPARPAAADRIATGLSRQTPPGTRLIQSSPFFSTPDIALLYSGPAITTASAALIWSASICTSEGNPCASRSPS